MLVKYKKNKKKFTLIELIITVLIMGLLAGLVIPKFINIKREADIATLYRDIDTLDSVLTVYSAKEGELPLGAKVEIDPNSEFAKFISKNGESGKNLYKIDINKTKKYHTKLKSKIDDNSYFIYSKETGYIYYSKGLINKDNELIFGIDYNTYIRNVMLGKVALGENTVNIIKETNPILTGEVREDKEVTIKLNGSIIPVNYEFTSYNNNLENIYAANNDKIGFKKFKTNLNLNKNIKNKLEIKIGKIKKIYIIKVEKISIDLSKYSAIIYVDSQKGDDITGDGSEEKPYKSITKAIDSIKVDNTAIKIVSGIYYEKLKHVPGTYHNREYALVRATPNKSYALVGDRIKPPRIIVTHNVNRYGYIIQQQSNTLNKSHTYELYNLIFEVDNNSNSIAFFSDLECDYGNEIYLNNIVVNNYNNKIHRIFYLNGGVFGTTRHIKIYINNSILQGNYLGYANGTGNIQVNNSIFNVRYGIAYYSSAIYSFIFDNSIIYPYKNTKIKGTYYNVDPYLNENFKIKNTFYKDKNIGVYYGKYSWE